jgi:sec-independent protein translocase protein TatA
VYAYQSLIDIEINLLNIRRIAMFGLGTQELLIILVLVMIIFGAGKLPQVGGALGKGLRNFKKGVNETEDDIEEGQVEEIPKKDGDKKKDA